jgi:hypothetical protein
MTFESFDALREATGFGAEAIFVEGYSVFRDAPEPAHARRDSPLLNSAAVDVSLQQDAAPVDAGARLPGINDDFEGEGPDIGARELGAQMPVYGPRDKGLQKRLREYTRSMGEEE